MSLISVVIRTYNESRYLAEVLTAITRQEIFPHKLEIIVVDSGSTDGTVDIARSHECHVTSISKEQFTFGRSLNEGCRIASGDLLVFISGHCVPVDGRWLCNLIDPLIKGVSGYSYGRQIGREGNKFSESQVYKKYYPIESKLPQEGYFCNNANAALTRQEWERYRFNEDLTGLEDMFLAKQIIAGGGHVAYVAEAVVYHVHHETWKQIKIRYEREAIALQQIIPEAHISPIDLVRCVFSSVYLDIRAAIRHGCAAQSWREIFLFRCCQYWGSFVGNREHRRLSHARKRQYFYPNEHINEKRPFKDETADNGTIATKGS